MHGVRPVSRNDCVSSRVMPLRALPLHPASQSAPRRDVEHHFVLLKAGSRRAAAG